MIQHKDMNIRAKSTFDNIQNKISTVHGSRYTYDKSVFLNVDTKMVITCRVHGDFPQSLYVHLKGSGCKECGHITRSRKRKLTQEKFIQKANSVHGGTYLYDNTVYKGAGDKVTVTCKIHGDFSQTANNHTNGLGCTKCGRIRSTSSAQKLRRTTEGYISEVSEVHGNTYSYVNTIYSGILSKVEIVCKIHGSFWQRADSHLHGEGCIKCGSGGFNTSLPGTMYYLKVEYKGKTAYKIGITNRSVKDRFSITELKRITVLSEELFTNGQDCYDKEQEILKKFKEYKYSGPSLLKNGNTELFVKDILNATQENK